MKKINIAIIGFGTVGTGVYKLIQIEKENIKKNDGLDLEIKKVFSRHFHYVIPDEIKCSSVDEICNDPDIDIVVETMGGVNPAKDYVIKLLAAKKTVVSANKQLIAMHWVELEEVAAKNNAGFYYEGSVGGGIPVIRTMDDSLQANTVDSLMAILNGTTNYILTKMSHDHREYRDVLKEAQELGYAEADPTSDVDGFDTTYKLSILASKAFHMRLPVEDIYREGISKLSKKDIEYAADFGYIIKLLAIAKKKADEVEIRVHPTMISQHHPLANVLDSFNAIFMHGNAVGDIMLYGRGAGDFPTASAIVSDIIYATYNRNRRYTSIDNRGEDYSINRNWICPFYLRLELLNVPGVLAQVTKVMGDHNISILSLVQKDASSDNATVVVLTYPSNEQDIQKVVRDLDDLDVVRRVCSVIRMEND